MSKRILVVLSEWGYWGEELVGPVEAFDEQGYEIDFMTPTGKRPVAIGVSMDPDYVDPLANGERGDRDGISDLDVGGLGPEFTQEA